MPPNRRTQAATRASTTTVHLGSKRVVKELPARMQVVSAHGEFGQGVSESSARNSEQTEYWTDGRDLPQGSGVVVPRLTPIDIGVPPHCSQYKHKISVPFKTHDTILGILNRHIKIHPSNQDEDNYFGKVAAICLLLSANDATSPTLRSCRRTCRSENNLCVLTCYAEETNIGKENECTAACTKETSQCFRVCYGNEITRLNRSAP
ncbi:hypothetical protein LSAT2_000707 [Lamellibrachia satsuma]|nr:hypothetical protein LSAT2_000707 [Lamellibrachia satsuma]